MRLPASPTSRPTTALTLPTGLPRLQRFQEAFELHKQAQKAKEESSAGSDGWRPIELSWLPAAAWKHRARVLAVAVERRRFPQAYKHVNTPSIPKKADSSRPLDQSCSRSSLPSTELKSEHGTRSSAAGFDPTRIRLSTGASRDTSRWTPRGMRKRTSSSHSCRKLTLP